MWHHSFDVHKQVPSIPEASLIAPPMTIRSQNVNEVLGKLSMPALVQDAINKAASVDKEMKDDQNKSIRQVEEEAISQQEDEKL